MTAQFIRGRGVTMPTDAHAIFQMNEINKNEQHHGESDEKTNTHTHTQIQIHKKNDDDDDNIDIAADVRQESGHENGGEW